MKDSTTWDVILEGQIAVHDSATIEVTHHDPDAAYVAAVGEALAEKGITIDQGWADTTARVDTLATLTSPPLSEILKALMKPSQNQIAEMLFRTVAITKPADSARAVVGRQIASWGVAVPSEAIVRDGSGLARYDYISPRTVVRILDAMRKAPTFQVFYDALPIGGVDGTIRNRMKGTPAERQRSREDRLGGAVAVALRIRDHGRSAHAHLQFLVQQLDGAGALRRDGPGLDRRAPRRHAAALAIVAFSVQEASERILAAIRPLGTESVPLRDALGRVLASDARSPIEHPPWDNSSMDGYAVRAADVAAATASSPVVLPVAETVRAGQRPSAPLEAEPRFA